MNDMPGGARPAAYVGQITRDSVVRSIPPRPYNPFSCIFSCAGENVAPARHKSRASDQRRRGRDRSLGSRSASLEDSVFCFESQSEHDEQSSREKFLLAGTAVFAANTLDHLHRSSFNSTPRRLLRGTKYPASVGVLLQAGDRDDEATPTSCFPFSVPGSHETANVRQRVANAWNEVCGSTSVSSDPVPGNRSFPSSGTAAQIRDAERSAPGLG